MIVPIGRQSCSRRTCSTHVFLLLLVLLLTGVLAGGSRVGRSKKHRTSRGASAVARWQSRASTDGTANAIHELAAKPAPFSKPAHSGTSGQPKKRSYYAPTVTNLENNLHHFINNLKSSKLAHAVNGVTGAFQQAVQSIPVHGPVNLLAGHRPVHNAAGYYANANELRYGQPFVSKQTTGSHFKSATASYGNKGVHGAKKRGRHQATASPPGKYDSLMSDLGISGYKHFENAVIRDLERREELKVEATIHTLFPEAGDEDWRPIASIKPAPIPAAGRDKARPEPAESKIVTSLTVPSAKRPLDTSARTAKPKPSTKTGTGTGGRYTSLPGTSVSPKTTLAPSPKHRTHGKEKRTKERVKCWNCATSTSTTRLPGTSVAYPTTPRLPVTGTSPQRFGPTYDASMFYGNGGKAPAAVAQSYSNVEVQYNRTNAPPVFSVSSWTQHTPVEVSTQSAPPVTTTFAAQSEVTSISSSGSSSSLPSLPKKSFSKAPKPYVPATSYLGPQGEAAVTSATTHKPTGGTQGTKGTTRKRTNNNNHRLEAGSHHHRPIDQPGDSVGAGSALSELRTKKKKFDPKYSRNRGSIKFRDALKKNPDQIYR